MNLIQRQADDFLSNHLNEYDDYKEFLQLVRNHLKEYKKIPFKIEFTQWVIGRVKVQYDEHLKVCTATIKDDCPHNKYYENTLFFLQEEIEELEGQLNKGDFTLSEKHQLNQVLQKIVDDLNQIKLGQQITYDDLKNEFEELKDYYYLNKKNWMQLFAGKLTEMVASGVISETISKDIVDTIKINYSNIVGS